MARFFLEADPDPLHSQGLERTQEGPRAPEVLEHPAGIPRRQLGRIRMPQQSFESRIATRDKSDSTGQFEGDRGRSPRRTSPKTNG